MKLRHCTKALELLAGDLGERCIPMQAERLGLCALQAAALGKDQEALLHWRELLVLAPDDWVAMCGSLVGRCRLTVSKPVLEAPLVSALETKT